MDSPAVFGIHNHYHKRLGKYTYMLGNSDRRHDGFPSEGNTIMDESYTLDKQGNKKEVKEEQE